MKRKIIGVLLLMPLIVILLAMVAFVLYLTVINPASRFALVAIGILAGAVSMAIKGMNMLESK